MKNKANYSVMRVEKFGLAEFIKTVVCPVCPMLFTHRRVNQMPRRWLSLRNLRSDRPAPCLYGDRRHSLFDNALRALPMVGVGYKGLQDLTPAFTHVVSPTVIYFNNEDIICNASPHALLFTFLK